MHIELYFCVVKMHIELSYVLKMHIQLYFCCVAKMHIDLSLYVVKMQMS